MSGYQFWILSCGYLGAEITSKLDFWVLRLAAEWTWVGSRTRGWERAVTEFIWVRHEGPGPGSAGDWKGRTHRRDRMESQRVGIATGCCWADWEAGAMVDGGAEGKRGRRWLWLYFKSVSKSFKWRWPKGVESVRLDLGTSNSTNLEIFDFPVKWANVFY